MIEVPVSLGTTTFVGMGAAPGATGADGAGAVVCTTFGNCEIKR